MINNLYRAKIWTEPLSGKHQSVDPTDNYLLNLIDTAQPDYAVTGDRHSRILPLKKLGRTRILAARDFCDRVLR